MPRFSLGQKEALVKKALQRDPSCSLRSFSQDNQVGYSTLYRWMQLSRNGQDLGRLSTSTREPSVATKFAHVLATAKLSDTDIGAYCRANGIYHHDVQQWEQELMSNKEEKEQAKLKLELKKLKAINKKLKVDLNRKDKALAEASALLILKKKADSIWGEDEED